MNQSTNNNATTSIFLDINLTNSTTQTVDNHTSVNASYCEEFLYNISDYELFEYAGAGNISESNASLSNSSSNYNASHYNFNPSLDPSHPCYWFLPESSSPSPSSSPSISSSPSLAPSLAPSWFPSSVPTVSPTTPHEYTIKTTVTELLVDTIKFYGTVYVSMMILFCFIRRKYSKYYNVRSWAEGIQCDLAKNAQNYGLFSWMWEVFNESEDDIMEQCGMDALCFIRVLRMGRKFAIMGCFHACWLIPVYATATAEEGTETDNITDSLVTISTSHVPAGDNRFLGTVIAAYCIFLYCMWLMKQELKWYTDKRHQFLQQRRPRNYAIYVSGIPEELRNGNKLAEFFRQAGATTSVLEAQIVLACPELDSLVAQRESVKERLAHAKAYAKVKGARERMLRINLLGMNMNGSMHHGLSRSAASQEDSGLVGTVDTIEMLEMRLRQLTKDIAIAYQNIERYNDPYTLEEHRDMIMEEIEETKQAERAQYIATRERVNSFHDLENVEEICHFEEKKSPEKKLAVNEQFSKFADSFFFGDLTPKQSQQEQQKLLHRQGNRQNDNHKVSIDSGHNKVHYMSWHSDDDDSFGTPDHNGGGAEEKKQGDRSSRRLLNSKFPSRSTISTVSGTFEHHNPPRFTRGDLLPNDEVHVPRSEMIEEASSVHSDESDTSRTDGYNKVLRAVHGMQGDKENGQLGEEEDELRDSVRSWKSDPGTAIKTVGEEVGKTVLQVGASVGKVTKTVSLQGVYNVKEQVNKLTLKNVTELGVGNIKTIRDSAAAIAPAVLTHEEGKALNGGFVVFKDLYTTQAALQMLHHKDAGVMKVEEAPGPDEVFWRNVGLPGKARQTGKLLALAATVALCIFWTIPITFISSLTEVDSLKEESELIAGWVEKFPNLELVLGLLSPFLLLMLQDVLLPQFLEWFSAWEGHVSSSALESAVFIKYAAFVLIQTFFISALSGTIAAELANFLNNPDMMVERLAIALPAQSNFFLQLLVVTLAVNLSMEVLRVTPLGLAFVRRYVGPNLTEEERNKEWRWFNPVSKPYEFEHANISGTVLLFFMVFFVYSCLAPVVSFFLLVMFICMEIGYRYNFYCNYPPYPDSGGKTWKGCFYLLLACIIFAEVTMIGFLVLKDSLFAIPFMVPLIVISILFIIYLNRYKIHAADHLPTSICVRVDQQNRVQDFSFVKEQYIQPAIREARSDEVFELIW